MDTITLIPVERKAKESAYSKDDEDYEKLEYPWRACMALTRHGLFIHDWPQNETDGFGGERRVTNEIRK